MALIESVYRREEMQPDPPEYFRMYSEDERLKRKRLRDSERKEYEQ